MKDFGLSMKENGKLNLKKSSQTMLLVMKMQRRFVLFVIEKSLPDNGLILWMVLSHFQG